MEQETRHVETPVVAIRTAKQFLWFAWFLYDAVQRGAITAANFADEMAVDEAGAVVRWRPEERQTQEHLTRWTWNTILSAMAISAQAVDRALDDTFGLPRPRDRQPVEDPAQMNDRDATRTVMYMVRNAFAHDPLNPRWQCKGTYVGVFRISAVALTLDTASLNGEPQRMAMRR